MIERQTLSAAGADFTPTGNNNRHKSRAAVRRNR